jgi:hypothetical protein
MVQRRRNLLDTGSWSDALVDIPSAESSKPNSSVYDLGLILQGSHTEEILEQGPIQDCRDHISPAPPNLAIFIHGMIPSLGYQ